MSAKLLVIAASALVLSCAASPALATFGQQGAKLIGTGAVGQAGQGSAVAVSADGNTAIMGGSGDNASLGAAWVYTRSAGVWSQQGAKLIGTGAVQPVGGLVLQGAAVAISADGNTAIVAGYYDNDGVGALWVFTRTAGVWSQQGAKLVGTGAVGKAYQGFSAALSGDGNTAIVGGPLDNSRAGAAWVFTRSAGVWSQQGAKLVGAGSVGESVQGNSVAISADGTTAMVGGPGDNTNVGATWVFTRSAGVWSQQGAKLIGTGAVGEARQGTSVALSGNGSTAIASGYGDNGVVGAVWVFTRSAGVWSQQGAKLVGTGAVGTAQQGNSVAVSADGNTAIAAGYVDNNFVGAAWVYKRRAGVWSQRGAKLVGTGGVNQPGQGTRVALSGDGNTLVSGGASDNTYVGATWVFVEGPLISAIKDIPNDQGGKVGLRWTASLLDNAPGNPINEYWIWRRVPSATALYALANGATLAGEGENPAARGGRVFRSTVDATNVYYWEYLASQVAHGFPAYSYTASTLSDSVPGSNPYTLYMVEAEKLSTGEYWSSDPDSGYSVDNLPPGPPAPHAALYAAGVTHLYWEPNGDADFAQYRLYRGGTAGFVPGPATYLTTQSSTSYDDAGVVGCYYKVSAVDTHGNESSFVLIGPTGTVGVDDAPALAFALEGARPNPTRGDNLSVTFALPSGAAARVELLDMSGRRMLTREVGSLGAGRHSVKLSEGRRLAPGLYWVRLTQAAMSRTARVVVIE